MSIRGEIEKLKREVTERSCPHCKGLESAAGLAVHFDDNGEPVPPPPKCPHCGREGLLVVFHVAPEAAGPEVDDD